MRITLTYIDGTERDVFGVEVLRKGHMRPVSAVIKEGVLSSGEWYKLMCAMDPRHGQRPVYLSED